MPKNENLCFPTNRHVVSLVYEASVPSSSGSPLKSSAWPDLKQGLIGISSNRSRWRIRFFMPVVA